MSIIKNIIRYPIKGLSGEYLNKILTKGDKKVVSGVIEQYSKGKQIIHPDHIVKLENRSDIEAIEPIYPLTQGLTQKVLSKAIKNALELMSDGIL